MGFQIETNRKPTLLFANRKTIHRFWQLENPTFVLLGPPVERLESAYQLFPVVYFSRLEPTQPKKGERRALLGDLATPLKGFPWPLVSEKAAPSKQGPTRANHVFPKKRMLLGASDSCRKRPHMDPASASACRASRRPAASAAKYRSSARPEVSSLGASLRGEGRREKNSRSE